MSLRCETWSKLHRRGVPKRLPRCQTPAMPAPDKPEPACRPFVEEVPSADGRERRWHARVASVDWDTGTEASEEFRAASALARAALLQLSDDTIRAYLEHERSFSKAWQEAASFLQTAIMATPAELEQIVGEM